MNEYMAELPAELRAGITEAALRQGVSEAAWLAEAVREKLAVARELAYLAGRAERGNRTDFEQALSLVPATNPEIGDER